MVQLIYQGCVVVVGQSGIVFLFFFVRKISPELTSIAILPILLFLLRKTGPGLTSVLIFLYFIWDTATAWLDKQCVGACLGSEPVNPGLPKRSTRI